MACTQGTGLPLQVSVASIHSIPEKGSSRKLRGI